MELWIRSQDKTILTPISEKLQILANIDIPQEQYIIMYKGEELGNYKSKERTLEVLDEIQRILQPMIKTYSPVTESKEDYKNHCMKTELVGYETTYDIVALPTYVYEMPEK